MKRTLLPRLPGWILLILLLCTAPQQVQAHAGIERSDPPNNAVLEQSPHQISLWFTEPVALQFSSVRLLDKNGENIPGVQASMNADNPRLLLVEIPVLEPGVFSLNWQVLSGADGHATQGLLIFGIQQTPSAQASTLPAGDPPPWRAIARVLVNIALGSTFGALAISLALLFPGGTLNGTDHLLFTSFRLRAVLWSTGMSILGLAAGMAQWMLQVFLTGNQGQSIGWASAFPILTATTWGQLWVIRQVILIVLTVYLVVRKKTMALEASWWDWLNALVLAAGAIFTFARTTHAAGLDDWVLPFISDFVHLLAAGLWIGGLLALIFIVIPISRKQADSRFFQSIWANFGRFAALAVGLTLATGLINASSLVLSYGALWTSPYGQDLVRKTSIVLLVGLVGLGNSLALHPALAAPIARLFHRPPGWTPITLKRLPLTLLIEGCLGLAVFVFAGFLASTPPANGPDYRFAGAQQPGSLSQTVDDLKINLSVNPNQPGVSTIEVQAASSKSPAPADVLRVILRISYKGESLGTQSVDAIPAQTDTYRVSGSYFSLPGPWKIEVVVRRKGISDSIAVFNWNIFPVGYDAIAINFLLRIPLWIGAGLLLASTLALAAWFFLHKNRTAFGHHAKG